MRKDFKKILLLSGFAFNLFNSDVFATVDLMDNKDVITQRAAQLSAKPNYYLGDMTNNALAHTLGKPVNGVTTLHEKTDVLQAGVDTANSSLGTLTSNLATANTGISSANSSLGTLTTNVATANTDITEIKTTINHNDNGLAAIKTGINNLSTGINNLGVSSLKLTLIVDNLMHARFSNHVMANSTTRKFVGSNGAILATGEASGGAEIKNGESLLTLFSGVSNPDQPYELTPANKLSRFLRAVFGMSKTAFKALFTSEPADMADSRKVLTKVFDTVLGANRTGSANFTFGRVSNNQSGVSGTYGLSESTGTFGDIEAGQLIKDYFDNKNIALAASTDALKLITLLTDVIGEEVI